MTDNLSALDKARMTDLRYAELELDESDWESNSDLAYELWEALAAERALVNAYRSGELEEVSEYE